MTIQQAFSALITKIENNFLWLKNNKQNTLVSGTNIKTINNTSLLGSGNISISTGGTATDVQINGTSITSNNVANIVTNSAYNASSNKIATMADIPTIATSVSSSSTNAETVGAKLFYDTVGDIETALNTINSGSST